MTACVVRQPVFDRSCRVCAYELQFRSPQTGPDAADAGALVDLSALAAGKRPFVAVAGDCTDEQLAALPPTSVPIIQVPDTAQDVSSLIATCRKLKHAGFKLAMDDEGLSGQSGDLAELADIVRVNFLLSPESDRRQQLCQEIHSRGAQAFAWPIRSHVEFDNAVRWGYDYFQGHFFTKPDSRNGKPIVGSRLVYLQMLVEVAQPTIDYQAIEELLKHDVSLTHKLLTFMNSAWFGFRSEINSIHHALVLLGPAEIRKWFTLIAMRHLGSDKTDELVIQSLIRARVAELLSADLHLKESASELFLMGMFSLIDALTDLPMLQVMSDLPLGDRIKGALLASNDPFGPVLDLILAFESGWWGMGAEFAENLGIQESRVSEVYNEARTWADQAFAKAV